MDIGINQCGIIVMKKSRFERIKGTKPPNEWEIKDTYMGNRYKYLDILEADMVKDQKIKEKIQKVYTRELSQN